MLSSESQPKPKFLLDENVKKAIERFLTLKEYDVITAPKGVSNGKLAAHTLLQRRVLVINDSDFSDPVLFPKEKIFSVIWLNIAQDDTEGLLRAFSSLLKQHSVFEGYMIVLKEDGFVASLLGPKTSTK